MRSTRTDLRDYISGFCLASSVLPLAQVPAEAAAEGLGRTGPKVPLLTLAQCSAL
jgi:hypothetical protein